VAGDGEERSSPYIHVSKAQASTSKSLRCSSSIWSLAGNCERARRMLETNSAGVHQRRPGVVRATFGKWSQPKPTSSSAFFPLREDL
jgi:hypothetical protein